MTSIKGVLFDKDGTLIDFNKTWLPLYREAAKYLNQVAGGSFGVDELLAAGGFNSIDNTWQPDSLLASGSNKQILDFWEEQLGIPIAGQVLLQCKEIFSIKGKDYAVVVNDLPEYLSGWRSRGMMLGVATMDDEKSARETLSALGCIEKLDFICGADSGFGLKPEPGMVDAFCSKCGLATSEVVMVGDSPRDLAMGRNAGVGLTVGVLTGATSEKDLWEFADHVLADIGELSSVLTSSMMTQ